MTDAPDWPGLATEQVDSIAGQLLISLEKADALVAASAITDAERLEMVLHLEEVVAKALLIVGCPREDLAGWLRTIADRAAALRLLDLPAGGHA
ncbi:MAG TPA: hypothetical protein VNX29_07170 [Kaistia sp.]|nr:hypothetical protein [Kaistia sp.]